jgi:hypothetical protein
MSKATEAVPATDEILDAAPLNEMNEPRESDIANLAYSLWQSRGCPDGSPEEDWFRALDQLRSQKAQATVA